MAHGLMPLKAASRWRTPVVGLRAAATCIDCRNLSGFCGAYLALLHGGEIAAGAPITLEPGPSELNLRELFLSRQRRD